MKEFLNTVRRPEKETGLKKQIFNTVLVIILGLVLGTFSKMLDCTPSNALPYLFQVLDVGNFLGEMAFWILMAVVISVFSSTPVRAGINVFLFFAGMLFSYYAYTKWIAGFFPKSCIMIWIGFTVVSPFLAAVCWYAKGNGIPAFLLASVICGVLFKQAFAFGIFYFDMRSILNVLVWLAGMALFYKNPRYTAGMLFCSVIFAVLWRAVSPFGYL